MSKKRGKLSDETMESAFRKMEIFREKVQPVIDELHRVTEEAGVGFVADFCLGRFNGGLVTKVSGNVVGIVGEDFPLFYVIFAMLARQEMTLEDLAKAIVEDRLLEALIEWSDGSAIDIGAIKKQLDNPSSGDPELN